MKYRGVSLITHCCLAVMMTTFGWAVEPQDLIFSQYIEGSGYNKVVEIYNGTDQTIDLADYRVLAYHNGATDPTYEIPLEGQLDAGGILVVSNPGASQEILDLVDITDSGLNFNGDDTLLLVSLEDTVVDSIGQIGIDPGSEWGEGLASTKDHTLIRSPEVCQGDQDPEDTFEPAMTWIGYEKDSLVDLGVHSVECQSLPSQYTSIIDIQSSIEDGTDIPLYAGEVVKIRGIVTAAFENGFFVQGDGEAAWNGIYVYLPSGDSLPEVGDLVVVDGLVKEYYGLTELVEATYSRASSKNDLPEPVILSTAEISSEKWEGVLAQVNDVRVVDADLGYGEWSIDDGTGSARVDDRGTYSFKPETGDTLPHVRGVVDFSHGFFKIQPRADEDLGGANVPGTLTSIHEVQGSGLQSPMSGKTVTIEGVVVGDFQESGELKGFFIQEEVGDMDDDPLTSEGIFVYNDGYPVAVGDRVQLTGEVAEFYENTQVKNISALTVVDSGNVLPPATHISLPFADEDYLERYEGMLVFFPQILTVSENYNLGRYGELILSFNRIWNPTTVVSPGDEANALKALNDRNRLVLDDGSTQQNPDPVIYPAPELHGENTVRSGDTVADLSGVLYFSYGNYRVQATSSPAFKNNNPRTDTPEDAGGRLKVASFNVLNYFTTLDDENCPYQGGCRGADSQEEFLRQRAKIIKAIIAVDADILGLVELENDPADKPLEDLVQGLNDEAGAPVYKAIVTGAIGDDAIKVGMIYKSSTVAPEGDFALLDSSVDPAFIDTKNRPVLAQSFVERATREKLTIAVNHLKSKGSDCNELNDPDMGDGQGNCNKTRTAAAMALARWLNTDPTGSNDPDMLVIGDLNAYAKEDPVVALENSGYVNLLDSYIGTDAYSYVFYGQAGYLDHAMANNSLVNQVTGVTEWHINADEPRVLDYNTEFKSERQVVDYFTESPYRSSDHDPIVIGLNLNSASVSSICSTLGDNNSSRRADVDIFKFYGHKGDRIVLSLSPKEPTYSEGEIVAMTLKDSIKGARLYKRCKGRIGKKLRAKLPADGFYHVKVSETVKIKEKKRFLGKYCLAIESSAVHHLKPAALIE